MPLVVEISIAFSILIAFIVIGIFLFASANASTPSTCRRSTVMESADELLRSARPHHPLAAALLGGFARLRLTARLNVLARS